MERDISVEPASAPASERTGSDREDTSGNEPIAIVGMACRFPGAAGLDAFWRLLDGGVNAVTEGEPGSGIGRVGELFPEGAELRRACRFGAYLDELDLFDAAFFRISPVEAQMLDPQQRLMLETSWRALEDAGMDPDRLKGSRTGVYAGISNNEYRGLILDVSETTEPAASLYAVTGTSFNTAIGRVAYALGLEGPALALDTACSSSLVAIHQAVSSLHRGEADLALAGGVHTILSGRLLELRANAGMLSPDGRCATFDAAANGYVRGEGCGIVVLKRLAEAEADGDRIWGTIRGSALNQDGASPGLTVPSGPAQEKVIEAALQSARLAPADVDYVEAHGTGTEVGDPVEARATGTAYGRGRDPDRPLLIGSVKTNIGHLESAAGVAGVIKVMLAMNRGIIPRHLHFTTPNPEMDWDRLRLQVTAEPTAWPDTGGRAVRAGVSGFGWSGTNAHVVLERYGAADGTGSAAGAARPVAVRLPDSVAAAAEPAPAGRRARLLPLSGRSEAALRDVAERYLSWLDDRADDLVGDPAAEAALLADMAWTAAAGRSHFDRRAGVVFRDAGSLREGLAALSGAEGPDAPQTATKVAFAYTGQASQWVGMGETLYESESVVRAVLDRCDALLRADRGGSLLDVMFGRPGAPGSLDDPQWKQPAIYALECALTALWSNIGIRPDIVFGHSLGEIAAAHTAGVFGLEDGLRFAAARGGLIGALPGEGAMAAVFASPSQVEAAVSAHNAASDEVDISIAADNGAHQVLSGPLAAIEAIEQRFEADDVRVRRLRKSPAYHSAMVEPALDDLEAAIRDIDFAPPSLPFVSNLTGRAIAPGETLDAAYWKRQAREPVAFRACIETVAALGVDAIVEIGPQSVLGPMALLAWPDPAEGGAPVSISSLRRPGTDIPESEVEDAFAAAAAAVYGARLPLRFEGLFEGEVRRRIALPGYPFQRERHWVEGSKRRRAGVGHPLLGDRHESARGDIVFETEVFPSEPTWLNDHRVFGRLIAPGALYGAMAAYASTGEGAGPISVDDMQLHNALVFPEADSDEDGGAGAGRNLQVLLDAPADGSTRRVQILSKGDADDEWTLHAECRVPSSPGAGPPEPLQRIDPAGLKAGLSPVDLPAFYRAKAGVGIDLGPSFRTLEAVWGRPGEALAEIAFPAALGSNALEIHPLLLDGCFQVVGAARNPEPEDEAVTYLPFAWERLWLRDRLPDRLICHLELRERPAAAAEESEHGDPREIMAADLRLYDRSGEPVGELAGFAVKRATRAALLAAVEGVEDLLYEVVWRDSALPPGMPSADFLATPSAIAESADLFAEYLAVEDVEAGSRAALLADLETLAQGFALQTLDRLGWQRTAGETVESPRLRQQLKVGPEHERVFRRMLEMLARAGVLETADGGFVVKVASGDPLPDGLPADPDAFAAGMAEKYTHGSVEVGLFRRSADALPDVLLGGMDPLTLLFSSGEPTAADLYKKAPVARAANRMLADATAALLKNLPAGRKLRIIEVGAGTGSATAVVLPELPEGGYDYTYTDISAGFFSEAESLFGGAEASIDYRVLDIEVDPIEQGFDRHGYDLVIASNVLHATRYLDETLDHCCKLLAPSGQLLALENLRGQGWLDLTFGQLDGWWRFADDYRPNHALAEPAVWRRALTDTGYGDIAILGFDASDPDARPDRGVIMAQGPADVTETPGLWVLAADRGGAAAELAKELAAHNQTVVIAGAAPAEDGNGTIGAFVEPERRESWKSLFEDLPSNVPLRGVVHLAALDGHGAEATTGEMADNARQAAASGLALGQGLLDADTAPESGVWFVTRGAQVLEQERNGQLAGATLWGLGKVMAREAVHLQPRMIDLDPADEMPLAELANDLLYPDAETHIAYRFGRRQGARLVRAAAVTDRLALPDEPGWELEPDAGGSLDAIGVAPVPARRLAPGEVRAAIEAFGLNFRDVFIAIGLVDDSMGGEFCGRVLEVGEGVSSVAVGDRVVGMTFRNYGSETVTLEKMIVPAPPGFSVTELATIPTAFVSAALSFELSGLNAGDRVLIHAGAGGVGLAAIQLAQAAGAEVFATASARKRDYLRSLGVKHVFDSRTTAFGQDILDATGGVGVDMVLNSLTGEGFIEASLLCLAKGGRFVEMGRVDILSEEEMAAARPDVSYAILMIDVLKEEEPEKAGEILRRLMARLESGELTPLVHARCPVSETARAMKCMQGARHIGKIVLTNSALARGRLRDDRIYLVTGGLGGIGCAVAGWLAERGAGTIVLNGRRPPDPEIEEEIEALRRRGATVQVELADVTEAAAMDAMLARMDAALPPLGGVIHSVGVLADAALGNQSWESFETVLWPKMLGAWHLHRATMDRDLDLFILFSSAAGVMGNPGQANHAAANAFLDQLAAHRRALGLPGQAIAWGAWSGLGEAEEQRERIARRLEARGAGWISPQQGLKAFDRLVRQDPATSTVVAIDWPVFAEAVEYHPPLLENLLSAATDDEDDAAEGPDDLMSRFRVALPSERDALLISFLQREVQAVLRLPSAPPPAVGFFDLGMDSLIAVELRNRLNRTFAGEYAAPNTLVFDYPDIAALAGHLAGELGDAGSAAAPEAVTEAVPPQAAPRDDDGIAIVGMAGRFPGAPDIETFWQRLEAGHDAVTDGRTDTGSWAGIIGDPEAENVANRRGGFVDGIDLFDARFFGIRPIEARSMDPQQRMLLETSWLALEDAGIDPEGLKGSLTGVYAGVSGCEYRDLMSAGGVAVNYLGTTGSVAAGRIAFAFGLMGPAIPLDMTCASSLVAIHEAVMALQRGEVKLALAGGVKTILSPETAKYMVDLGLLSASGRCSSFDASADGHVRGEGCGIVVLKRLADAEADGDRIWATIRGTAVNQNGASAGLTVPNGPAQEQVIETALTRAGIAPADVDYLEAHGTGSALGDPIEVQAAASVYGRGREAGRPLLIGTAKSNIGHLEAAAGVAGLIKAVLAVRRGTIPKQLHFRNPNPQIEWDRLPVKVVSEATEWPAAAGRPRRAGVSAFAVSGTNAHVMVEEYGAPDRAGAGEEFSPAGAAQQVAVNPGEAVPEPAPAERSRRVLPLSGKSDAALRDLAKQYLTWLDERAGGLAADKSAGEGLLADMAWTAGTGRSHFAHRAGIVFHDAPSLREALRTFAAADARPEPRTAVKAAFAYTGAGSQWTGMGAALYESEPAFRAVLDRCEAALRTDRSGSLLDAMFGRAGAGGSLDDPLWMQPAVYTLQCALTALWSTLGIRPGAVFGHGPGELAAARAAGVFGLEDGLRIAAARRAAVAAMPGERAIEAAFDDVDFAPPACTLVSGITGRAFGSGEAPDAAYWQRQGREPFALQAVAETLAGLQVDAVLEIGPEAALGPAMREAWPAGAESGMPPVLAGIGRPAAETVEFGDEDAFAAAVGGAYEAGLSVDWAGMFAGERRRRISLPSYPFQRQRFWIKAAKR